MMILSCWVRGIRGRWSRRALSLFLVLVAQAAKTPSPLADGIAKVEQGDYEAGLRSLAAAEKLLPQLGDYVAFYLAKARLELKQYEPSIRRLESVLAVSPDSPLAGQAALLAARAYLETGAPQRAVEVLKNRYPRLPQPDGDLALASACEAAGELARAASFGQRVYHAYPASKQAAEALEAMKRLREKLGTEYPPPLPTAMLERAGKWMEARDYGRARAEYESLAPQLGGTERELAQVRAAEARYLNGGAQQACADLKALSLGSPEADAERLYYLVQCARTLEDPQAMLDFVGRLNVLYPASEWRLGALIWAGNYYLLRNDPGSYVPLYRACSDSFPEDPRTATCHWRVAWNAYLRRRDESRNLLLEHLERFPHSEKCPAALYFLGRLSEESGGRDAARSYYRRILEEYPNNYYAQLALARAGGGITASAARLSFEPSAGSRYRIARSRLLVSEGLHDLAEAELRFAAGEDGQPQVLATELARQASARGAPDQAIRYVKAVFPDYLKTPLDTASAGMWRLAFPLPFRQELERNATLRGLDLYLVAGLIRQESEFSPGAVSRANAYGLMQVMPATGRELARQLKLGRFSTSLLRRPDYNLRLGTVHLRSLLDQHEGSVEAALASYNAGKTRADLWLTWATYREPAEFVETIPITETRTYVQAVLRNAWMYRRIYASNQAAKRKASAK